MGWLRSFLVALVLASWTQVADACVEDSSRATQPPQTSMQMVMPCGQMAPDHEHPACECLTAMVRPRAALAEAGKLVSFDSGTVVRPPAGTLTLAGGREGWARSAGPKKHPPYLITSRLRL